MSQEECVSRVPLQWVRVNLNRSFMLKHSRWSLRQQQLRKVVAKQARQLQGLVPISKKFHKLSIEHEALERRAEAEEERALELAQGAVEALLEPVGAPARNADCCS